VQLPRAIRASVRGGDTASAAGPADADNTCRDAARAAWHRWRAALVGRPRGMIPITVAEDHHR